MPKSEPKIEGIKITGSELRELKSELNKPNITNEVKHRIIKNLVGGVCIICGGVPSKKITYDADGATVIERYCNKCYKKRAF